MSLSCEDKLRLARRLDRFGVAFIEAGWPGSNPKDVEVFERARDESWQHAVIVAFGATRRAHAAVEDDEGLGALLRAGTKACTLFGKSWNLQVTEVLRTALDENLRMIEESLAYLAANGRRVIYDAEHFFDGYCADKAYALETLRAAQRGGAEVLVLCDTNGGTLPWQVEAVVAEVQLELLEPSKTPVALGIHTHDDAGCAVANALAAVRAGARHVQGTINGYGERCGNANLCSILPTLELKMQLQALPDGRLSQLYELSHYVAEVANVRPDAHLPYVGRSAFAHKGGVHVAAMRRNDKSYQHVDPVLVGNVSRVVVSELSGRGNVLSKAEEIGVALQTGDDQQVLLRIKEGEARGFSYEAAEASVAMLVHRQSAGYRAPFEVLDYQTVVGRRHGSELFAEATVKVRIGEQLVHTVADGNGPVAALDQALRKALRPSVPQIERIHLSGYKVRILDDASGTAAMIRVLIDLHSDEDEWSTVGASTNVIEASLQALVDGLEYGLLGSICKP